ncbi:hypothetical protein QC762_0091540 [Podospora pseudocomata]|uniref:Uncharacterized protein n=1 Tax=Podospora pseudocomata TaxID=2093779 RepID=A0ABR0G6S2_9PEZI|nr:hypothetical protein QC762_0091540 [Podospora pseudocomata]
MPSTRKIGRAIPPYLDSNTTIHLTATVRNHPGPSLISALDLAQKQLRKRSLDDLQDLCPK